MTEREIVEENRAAEEGLSRNGAGGISPESNGNGFDEFSKEIKTIAETEEYPYNF